MHTLPSLPYAYDALDPHFDALTMEIHHTKHHQAYIDKLNAALEAHPDLQAKNLEDLLQNLSSLPADIQTAVQNHGGGHFNHSLFWTILAPTPTLPSAQFAQVMDTAFGSLDEFQQQFTAAATAQFGSGWAWLTVEQGKLHICSTPNQDNPLMSGNTPILGLDVWEHAYYLKYQNRRPEYVQSFFQLINWPEVENRYNLATNK